MFARLPEQKACHRAALGFRRLQWSLGDPLASRSAAGEPPQARIFRRSAG